MTPQNPIQWFPGHMAKTRRLMRESMSLVDCVVEMLDARVPRSSRNPELDELCGDKPRVLLLGKCDLADAHATDAWVKYAANTGRTALAADCKSGRGLSELLPLVRRLLKEKLARHAAAGMAGRPIRIMVAGIPNSGKSSLINRLAGGRHVKAENRPGVTKVRQWISLPGGVELLDTPGILWPKFEDPAVGEKLALVGAVKDDVFDRETLASRLMEILAADYPQALAERFGLAAPLPENGFALLEAAALRRGMRISGGEADTERAATAVLGEFRSGKFGRISLEHPPRAMPGNHKYR